MYYNHTNVHEQLLLLLPVGCQLGDRVISHRLPDDVTSAPSLSTFRRHLKTHLFRWCYNTVWYCCTYSDFSGSRGGVAATKVQLFATW